LGLRELRRSGNGQSGCVELVDGAYDASERNTVMVLSTARTEEERAVMADKGPHISAILYEAMDIEKAFEDATWAGMEPVQAPAEDELTGRRLARLREPSGNIIYLREPVAA
jgi:predicted enzyme related to lactoylglutathione lyase